MAGSLRHGDLQLVHDGLGGATDEVWTHVNTVQLLEVSADVPHRHAPRVHRNNLLVEAVELALVLGDELGLECAVSVPGHLDLDLALRGSQGFVPLPLRRLSWP